MNQWREYRPRKLPLPLRHLRVQRYLHKLHPLRLRHHVASRRLLLEATKKENATIRWHCRGIINDNIRSILSHNIQIVRSSICDTVRCSRGLERDTVSSASVLSNLRRSTCEACECSIIFIKKCEPRINQMSIK